MAKMKCYVVTDPDAYEFGTVVVFAESAGKAKYKALFTDEMGDLDDKSCFIYFKAERFPQGDSRYTEGKYGLDWDDPDDRRVMVEHLGWYCNEEYDIDCPNCSCKDVCSRYELEKDDYTG